MNLDALNNEEKSSWKPDSVEKKITHELNLQIYIDYKKLHAEEKARRLLFRNSVERQYEYGYTNLTTLHFLGSAYWYLNLLDYTKHPLTPEFLIKIRSFLIGFFVSLSGVFDSIAQEINIFFNLFEHVFYLFICYRC